MARTRIGRGASLAAIEAAYRANSGKLLRVAVAVLGSEEEAWDAVQDATARAISERRGFRGDGPVEAWLWRIVLNTARSRQRNATVRARVAVACTPFEPPDRDDRRDALRALVTELPERQRLALFLRYYADLDYEGIAAVLGISANTVGPTLSAAQASLRRLMEGDTE